MSEKEEKFNQATKSLINLSQDYNVKIVSKFSLPDLTKKLREIFKNPDVYKNILGFDIPENNPGRGFCLLASYYIMQKTGGDKVWKLMKGVAHWWLVHKESGKIFDITYDQFPRYYNYNIGNPEIRIGKSTTINNIVQSQAKMLDKYLEV